MRVFLCGDGVGQGGAFDVYGGSGDGSVVCVWDVVTGEARTLYPSTHTRPRAAKQSPIVQKKSEGNIHGAGDRVSARVLVCMLTEWVRGVRGVHGGSGDGSLCVCDVVTSEPWTL